MYSQVQDLINDFALFDDWEERYAYLIDLGKNLPYLEEEMKTEETLVPGCTSRVWMIADVSDGVLYFRADSDAHIVRGLIGVLARIYNQQPIKALKEIDIKAVFQKLGLESHLSPNRRNGFFSMVERLQSAASSVS